MFPGVFILCDYMSTPIAGWMSLYIRMQMTWQSKCEGACGTASTDSHISSFVSEERKKKKNKYLFLAKPCLQFPALICIIPSSDPETGCGGGKTSLFQPGETSPFSCLSFPGHIPPPFTTFTDESKFSDAAETPLPAPSCVTLSPPWARGMKFVG